MKDRPLDMTRGIRSLRIPSQDVLFMLARNPHDGDETRVLVSGQQHARPVEVAEERREVDRRGVVQGHAQGSGVGASHEDLVQGTAFRHQRQPLVLLRHEGLVLLEKSRIKAYRAITERRTRRRSSTTK